MLIDTHIWVWWVNGSPQLKPEYRSAIIAAQGIGIEVSIISCWEVAKLVENNKIELQDILKLVLKVCITNSLTHV